MVLVAIFLGIGLLVGLVLPRWWTLVCVPPAVVVLVGLVDSPLPAGIHWWIALVAGASAALGIGLGLLIRRLAREEAAST